PQEMPELLHWFKWQAGITWLSGAMLLGIVYYMGGGAFLVDPTVSSLSPAAATGVGIGTLVVSWLVYDLLWKSPLKQQPRLALGVTFLYVLGVAFALTHLLSPRAAYLHVGAMLGTMMAGNVWMVILPSQRQLVGATERGEHPDPALAAKAKQRSIHNNYITFPLLFIMVSNHFPGLYGHQLNWIILGVIMLAGATVRHLMNIRFTFEGWVPAVSATVVIAIATLVLLTSYHAAPKAAVTGPVTFAAAHAIVSQRCVACHSKAPSDPAFVSAPAGVTFDSPENIRAFAPRIKARAVLTMSMPLGNKTGMTETERAQLGQWIDAGARLTP
ncbi:MAG TPA: urate hydroxylase PuuD, partial [Stenomitos sp.]